MFLLRIHDQRKDWLYMIKKIQTLDESYQLYICDLHFSQNDVKKYKKKCVLAKGAIPSFKYVFICVKYYSSLLEFYVLHKDYFENFSLQTSNDIENNTSENDSLNFLESFDFLNNQEDPVQYAEPNLQMISITKEEYTNLKLGMLEVEKLKNVIDKMANIIKHKDAKLKEQQKTHQRDQKTNNNLSKLSTVIRTVYSRRFKSSLLQIFFILS